MQHGIQDESGLAPFEVGITAEQLAEEKLMARFSKSKEFKRLKEHLEERIGFYRSYLPNGQDLSQMDAVERGNMWLVANTIVNEFQGIINAYESIAEAVKNAERQDG